MNNRIIPSLIITTLLLTTACNVLEVEPVQQVEDSQAITNAAGAQAAILGYAPRAALVHRDHLVLL